MILWIVSRQSCSLSWQVIKERRDLSWPKWTVICHLWSIYCKKMLKTRRRTSRTFMAVSPKSYYGRITQLIYRHNLGTKGRSLRIAMLLTYLMLTSSLARNSQINLYQWDTMHYENSQIFCRDVKKHIIVSRKMKNT